jgi:hypothetical protein
MMRLDSAVTVVLGTGLQDNPVHEPRRCRVELQLYALTHSAWTPCPSHRPPGHAESGEQPLATGHWHAGTQHTPSATRKACCFEGNQVSSFFACAPPDFDGHPALLLFINSLNSELVFGARALDHLPTHIHTSTASIPSKALVQLMRKFGVPEFVAKMHERQCRSMSLEQEQGQLRTLRCTMPTHPSAGRLL